MGLFMKQVIKGLLVGLSAAFISSSVLALPDVAAAPDNAKVYFISPANGAVVSSPVKVVMGLAGMGVAPAGTVRDNTGHHHLIISAPTPKAGEPIASDANHKHFGGGQTETSVELSKGEHTLQLVLGDFIHRPHANPVVSEVITITVK